MLQGNKTLQEEDKATLPFEQRPDGLIYYRDAEYGPRLCIPDHDGLIKGTFELVHDELGLPDTTGRMSG